MLGNGAAARRAFGKLAVCVLAIVLAVALLGGQASAQCAYGWGVCPGGGCAPLGSVCCPDGTFTAQGRVCCGGGRSCPGGSICTNTNECLPYHSRRVCSDGSYCPPGFECEYSGPGGCYRRN